MTRAPLPDGPAGIAYRSFEPATDYPLVADLIRECNRVDGIDWYPTSQELEHDWSHNAGFDPASDALLALEDERVVGLVDVDWRERGGGLVTHHAELFVHPAARRRGIGNRLLGWSERHSRELVAQGRAGPIDLPHEMMAWGDTAVPGHAELAARRGYEIKRHGHEMLRRLDGPVEVTPLPPGLQIRPVEPGQYRAIWDADVEAFRDHREPAVRTEADFQAWFTRPTLDTSTWQVAWDGHEVAGSVLTFVSEEENELLGLRRAWLDHISVRRPWRRQGVAAALITAAMARLRERGFDQAALGVDAENPTGALRLYERLGFVVDRSAVGYRKPI